MVPRIYRELSHNACFVDSCDSSFLLKNTCMSPLCGCLIHRRNRTREEKARSSSGKTDDGPSDAESFFLKSRYSFTFFSPALLLRGVQSGIDNLAPRRINKPARVRATQRERRTQYKPRTKSEDITGRDRGRFWRALGGKKEKGERDVERNCEHPPDREWLFLYARGCSHIVSDAPSSRSSRSPSP